MSDLNDPPDAGDLDPPSLQPDLNLKAKGSTKIIFIVAAVLVAGAGIGFAAYRISQGHKEAKVHAAFLERFQNLEKKDLGKFWLCVLGKDTDPGMFADNLQLSQRIQGAFQGDPLHYPDKIMEDCASDLSSAAKKVKDLDNPSEYQEGLDRFQKSLTTLEETLTAWAQNAKQYGPAREAERKIAAAANAFHAGTDKPPPDAIGYAGFLHCAVPDLDKLADEQALLQRLFDECKKPEFVEKLHGECAKMVALGPDAKPDKVFKDTFKRFGADDRDTSAFDDCFRRGRKQTKKDDLVPFGKAWVDYMEASGAVRKQASAILKKD